MDIIFKRYSSPYTLLDELIANEMLSEHINTLNEEVLFDFEFSVWLNKVEDKSFNDWRDSIHSTVDTRNVEMSNDEIKTTIQKSSEILNNFEP